jgi:hypothetical protein
MEISKIIVSNIKEVKNEFKTVDCPRYKHYKEILTELEYNVKSDAENDNNISINTAVGYHRNENTGYLIFSLQKVETVDNGIEVTYEQSSSVGAW